MFTRLVEVHTKPGKAKEASATINEKILTILRNQPGFVDELTMVSDTDPDRIVAISFWKTPQDAERYNREQFESVQELLQPYLTGRPIVQTFHVDTSTIHKIAAGKAA